MRPSSEALALEEEPAVGNPLGLPEPEWTAITTKADPAWGEILETPCLKSRKLSEETECELHLKYENLQYTAAFKERGALAKLLSLAPKERACGVIAASAGNHAQGLARHAALLGIEATIVMPQHTPSVKVEATRRFGAKIVLHGDGFEEANAEAQRACAADGLTLVHPFDDPYVCAGQGTVAAEMLAQVPDIDTLVVPIGGGGLIAGIASVAKARRPDVRVVGVQAALYPGMINATENRAEPCGGMTLAEGIAVCNPGVLTRRIVGELVDEIVTVEERDLERALSLLLATQKTLVEGAGAAGLAAILAHPKLFEGRTVGSVLCGGNIDTRLLSSILMRDLARQRRLARLRITLTDVPGQLTRVSAAIGRAGGNVIDVAYHKVFNDLPAKQTHLDISVEANDGAHMDRIIETLRADGLPVETANY
ncbi:threonine ammonia-lyase [Parvularcula dongshanensis]|uniref:Threonine dehydratase n=1 Tax=Parvularcula dongshanensis TaxID=1173995 RepID=A0A840I2A6_9PROT|nr:threonine ammonia-lyase [Parvularcula dongshanensis]MBB4658877.1 threonine dehydratase [Parvularcula dongshanensis]